MDYNKQLLQDRISALGDEQGLTLYQLEKKIGLSRNSLKRCNINALSWDNLAKVADYFSVSMDYLAGRTERY